MPGANHLVKRLSRGNSDSCMFLSLQFAIRLLSGYNHSFLVPFRQAHHEGCPHHPVFNLCIFSCKLAPRR